MYNMHKNSCGLCMQVIQLQPGSMMTYTFYLPEKNQMHKNDGSYNYIYYYCYAIANKVINIHYIIYTQVNLRQLNSISIPVCIPRLQYIIQDV